MRISDWSSDVCSSDLLPVRPVIVPDGVLDALQEIGHDIAVDADPFQAALEGGNVDAFDTAAAVAMVRGYLEAIQQQGAFTGRGTLVNSGEYSGRSEEHTSELQSLMRTSYAVFCL